MPDITNVDSERLVSTADRLDGVVDQMNSLVGRFADAIEALDKGWTSEVKAAFMAGYRTDWEAMQEALAQLREFGENLRESAGEFDKTENDILGDVRALG